jgi:hypothetical protein
LAFPVLRQSSVPALSNASPWGGSGEADVDQLETLVAERAKPAATSAMRPGGWQDFETMRPEAGPRFRGPRGRGAVSADLDLLVERFGSKGVTNESILAGWPR